MVRYDNIGDDDLGVFPREHENGSALDATNWTISSWSTSGTANDGDMADDVDGIGEELSRDIAREFDSVADLHAADVEDIQRVDGIGEQRAKRLLEGCRSYFEPK